MLVRQLLNNEIENMLVIFGFGGHARSVADVAVGNGYTDIVFVDKNARASEMYQQFAVFASEPEGQYIYIPAAGDNFERRAQVDNILEQNKQLVSIISGRASVSRYSNVARGVFVGHNAHIGPSTSIGRGSIINTSAVVEHDCQIGEFSHISVNSTIAGRVQVGANVFVGAGAVIKDGLTIADNVTIGIGAAVVQDIIEPGTYVGVPARKRV